MNPDEKRAFLEKAFSSNAENDVQLPEWVKAIRKKINKSVFKEFEQYLDADPQNLISRGFISGAGKHLKKILTEKRLELESLIGHKLTDDELSELEDELSELDQFRSEETAKIEDSNQTDWVNFYKGFLLGGQSVFSDEGQIKHESLDTTLSLFMLMNGVYIEENIKTRKACYDYLIEHLGENRVGSYERVEKFLQRIGFCPAKPGRPPS